MKVTKFLFFVSLFAIFALAKGLYRSILFYNINKPGPGWLRFPMPPTSLCPLVPGNSLPKPVDYKPVIKEWTYTPHNENYKVVFFLVTDEIFYNMFEPAGMGFLQEFKTDACQHYVRLNLNAEEVQIPKKSEASDKGKDVDEKSNETKYFAYLISANEIPKGNATPIVQWIEAHHNPRATKRHPTEYVEIMSFGFGQDIFSISKPNTKYPIHENPKSNMKNLINKFINFWMIKGWGPRFQRIHILHVLTLKSISHEIKVPPYLEYIRTGSKNRNKFLYPPTFNSSHQFYEKPYGGVFTSFYIVDSSLWNKIISELNGDEIGPNLKILQEKAEWLRTTNQTYVYITCFSGYKNPLQEIESEFFSLHSRLYGKCGNAFIQFTAVHDVSIPGHKIANRHFKEFSKKEFGIIPILERFKLKPDPVNMTVDISQDVQPMQNSNAAQVPTLQIQSDQDDAPKTLDVYETILTGDYIAHNENVKRKHLSLPEELSKQPQKLVQLSSQSNSSTEQYLHPSSASSMGKLKRPK